MWSDLYLMVLDAIIVNGVIALAAVTILEIRNYLKEKRNGAA